jgi:hypothetical protein
LRQTIGPIARVTLQSGWFEMAGARIGVSSPPGSSWPYGSNHAKTCRGQEQRLAVQGMKSAEPGESELGASSRIKQ